MYPQIRRALSFVSCFLLAAAGGYAQHAFPAGYIPFSSIYYVTPPDAHGDQLVVGKMTLAAWNQIGSFPLPGLPGETFTDGSVQLAPGVYFSGMYLPIAAERLGDFSAFGGALIDPASGTQFPHNMIPVIRIPDPWAFRVQAPACAIGLGFYPVTPCRVADTRLGMGETGTFGPPAMAAAPAATSRFPLAVAEPPRRRGRTL